MELLVVSTSVSFWKPSEGFPLAHRTWAGNTQDLQTVKTIATDIKARFGRSHRVWV